MTNWFFLVKIFDVSQCFIMINSKLAYLPIDKLIGWSEYGKNRCNNWRFWLPCPIWLNYCLFQSYRLITKYISPVIISQSWDPISTKRNKNCSPISKNLLRSSLIMKNIAAHTIASRKFMSSGPWSVHAASHDTAVAEPLSLILVIELRPHLDETSFWRNVGNVMRSFGQITVSKRIMRTLLTSIWWPVSA